MSGGLEWELPPGAKPTVRLPDWSGGRCCNAPSPSVYICTRAEGHTGRHAATGLSGDVFEVWNR